MKNTVNIIGRIGKHVATRELDNDKCVTEFQVATEEIFFEGEEKIKTTEWHQVELWNRRKLAEILSSGMLVNIDGSLRTSHWTKTIGGETVNFYRTCIRAERVIILSKKQEATVLAEEIAE